MQESDREAFAMALIAASEVYRQEVSQQAIALWWQTLEPYPLAAVQAAVALHIKTSRFMPTPADLLAIIEGSPQDKAEAAWQKVLQAAQEHGQSRSVAFDDPLIPACVLAMGGFARICMCNIKDLHWLKREWMPLYQTYSIRPPDRMPRYLPGLNETHNKSMGYDRPEQVHLIGDQQQASTLLTQHELDTDTGNRLQALSHKAISALDHEPSEGEV